jgi:cysteinyl-tRNA synthetase
MAGEVRGLLPSREDTLTEPEEDPAISARKLEIAGAVAELLVRRTTARAAKDWSAADTIRDELNEMGVVVTDTNDGPTWELA